MSTRSPLSALVALSILAALATTAHAGYRQVYGLTTAQNGGTANFIDSIVVDGGNTYNLMRLGVDLPARKITKIVDADGAQVGSDLSTAAQLDAASLLNLAGAFGIGITNGKLRYSNFFANEFHDVDLTTGNASVYVSSAQIAAVTGMAPNLTASSTLNNGEVTVYDGVSDSIIMTNNGNVQVLLTDLELTAIQGNDTISGSGMAYDANGDLYWGDSTTDSVYKKDNGLTTGSKVLDKTDITALTGATAAGFLDLFYAPNGLMYFYESSSDSILSFDPTDPINSLAFVLTEAELLAGPAQSDIMGKLTWFDGNLAWTQNSSSSGRVPGFYTIPEPSALVLLGLGALGLLHRRRN